MIENLLQRLERVQKVGNNGWKASCPTRRDKTPSLSIRHTDEGVVLLHDFGGSSVPEILAALGMEVADLFPPRENKGKTKERIPSQELVEHLKADIRLVLVAARMVQKREPMPESDFVLFGEAIDRIHAGLAYGGVR